LLTRGGQRALGLYPEAIALDAGDAHALAGGGGTAAGAPLPIAEPYATAVLVDR
jgi:hypothetical protein